MKKQDNKWDFIKTNSLNGIKTIYILLTKIIIVYIKFSKIKFQKLSFKKIFLKICFG